MSDYNSFPVDINADDFKHKRQFKFRKEITDLIRRGIFPITYDFGLYDLSSSKIDMVLKELRDRNFICNVTSPYHGGCIVKIDI